VSGTAEWGRDAARGSATDYGGGELGRPSNVGWEWEGCRMWEGSSLKKAKSPVG
jgi:hypothetical protein